MNESDFIKAIRNNEYSTIKEKGIELVVKELDKKDKEIERLNNIIKEAIDKAKTMKASMLIDTIDGIEIDSKFVHDLYALIEYMEKELKGTELTENDKKQVKWLKEEFNVGADKE